MHKKLHVKAKVGILVQDPHAMQAGRHRYVGMMPKLDPPSAPEGRWEMFEVIADGVKVDEHNHIKEAVKRGELDACDEWTAKRCRVEWKPAKPAK